MLEELLRDQNRTLTELTGEVGAVKSTLKQYETTFEKINLQISAINQNINNNNIIITTPLQNHMRSHINNATHITHSKIKTTN